MVSAGGGFNALAAARRAGADVAYGGALGVGPFADIVRRALAAEGVDALQTQAADGDQGFCVVLVERGGERAYVYNAGAERRATAADLAALPAAEFAFALLGGYVAPEAGEPDIFGDWLERLPRGVKLMFDPTPLAVRVGPRARRARAGPRRLGERQPARGRDVDRRAAGARGGDARPRPRRRDGARRCARLLAGPRRRARRSYCAASR